MWAFFEQNRNAVRHGGMDGTIVGLDYVQLFALGDAYGLPKRILAELLPACEAGMLAGLAEEAGTYRELQRKAQEKAAQQPVGGSA